MELLLLHSPFTGPYVWSGLAPLLRSLGHDVSVPDLRPSLAAGLSCFPKRAALACTAPAALIVAHSGAGALVPSVAQATAARGAVYVDALLPHPGKCWLQTAPPPLAERLCQAADGAGLLPAWDRWWPKGTMAALLPDAAMRAAFIADLPRVPLAYVHEIAPDAPEPAVSAYLRLSSGYRAEADEARRRGWLVSGRDLHHLAVLTELQSAAADILRLAGTM